MEMCDYRELVILNGHKKGDPDGEYEYTYI